MLRDLHIRNLAVLAEAAVEFDGGLNALTGETGAGKSIVVDSLALLAGARAQTDLIRSGTDGLTVTGVFEGTSEEAGTILATAGIGNEDTIVVRREIQRSGRNRIFVNDHPVTLKLLSELAPFLLRIHGQRDELGLTQPELQRTWLDRQGGEEADRLRSETREAFERWKSSRQRLQAVRGDRKLRDERIDLLSYQIGEIDQAAVVVGEEDELRAERNRLRHAEQISEAMNSFLQSIFDDDGSATERVAGAADRLSEIAHWIPEAEAWCNELTEIRIRLEELVSTLRSEADRIEADPQKLAADEDRLATLERLLRKYGESTAAVIEKRAEMERELGELQDEDATSEKLVAETEAARASYKSAAGNLSEARQRWGKVLVEKLEKELAELTLPEARFEVQLEPRLRSDSPLQIDGRGVEGGPDGFDQVTFLFSPNPGEDLRPLSKVASGGELSRVYLALQLLSQGRHRPTLVFDEVDSGVGGVEALVLGRKLRQLASGGQILTVTHLPQVASQGDVHFSVRKQIQKGRTLVDVVRLGRPERVLELGRMLGGEEASETSRSHAESLLDEAASEATTP